MKKIIISDVTLRAMSANDCNVSLSFKEKLEVVKALSELKVDVIELPSAAGDKTGEVLTKTVSAFVTGSTVAIDAGKTEDTIEKNFSLISAAKKKRLILSFPISPIQMEYLSAKKPKAVLELVSTLTKKAVSLCEDVEVSFEDATRAEFEFLCSVVKTAISCGAKSITVSDISGNVLPFDFGKLIEDLIVNVPELKTVNLAVRCSEEFAFATANIFACIDAGANAVKLSAVSFGDLPPFEKVIASIENLGDKKGYSIGINKTAVNKTVKRISSFFSNKNDSVFETVSDKTNENLSSEMSASEFNKMIKKRGYDLSSEDQKIVYAEYKRLAEKKAVTVKDLDAVIATSVLQVPATYTLVKFSVMSSNVLTATASVVLKKDDKEIFGLSYGNGSVDAAFLALESIVGRHFELDNFELGSVTEGKEAVGQALVALRANGKIYSGRGVSTDIIGASIRAYVNAVNKIVYEEENK